MDQTYVDIGMERIHKLSEGTLKTRPIYQKIWAPKPTDKIAQVPDEWRKAE